MADLNFHYLFDMLCIVIKCRLNLEVVSLAYRPCGELLPNVSETLPVLPMPTTLIKFNCIKLSRVVERID